MTFRLDAFPLGPGTRYQFRDTWGAPRGGGTRPHEGVDIAAPRGSVIRAATTGRVVALSLDRDSACGLGVFIVSRMPERYMLGYCHMDAEPIVSVGNTVQAGDPIGLVGATGNATHVDRRGVTHSAYHLHLQAEALPSRMRINPFSELVAVSGSTIAPHSEWARGRVPGSTPSRNPPGGLPGASGSGWLLVALLAYLSTRGSS